MSTQTAQQAYKEKRKQINKRLATITKELDRHVEAVESIHYGHVGDISHVECLLHQIEAFLKNEDIDD